MVTYAFPEAIILDRVIAPVDLDPQPEPVGTRVYPGDEYIRVISDCLNPGMNYQSRTLSDKIKLAITNAMYVPHRWYRRDDGEWRVDQFSKLSFWPEDLSGGWSSYFFSGMTAKQRELFDSVFGGFGWRDGKADQNELSIYNFLLCTGALLKKIGRFREFTLFACQDTDKPADWGVSYYKSPDKWFKQSVSSHNAAKESFCGNVNQEQGDLYIPTACPSGIAAIVTAETVPAHPALPFNTFWNGNPVRFVELCFRGSEALGKTDDGLWLYIEQQTGDSGRSRDDFTLHVPPDDWCKVRPVPVVGWQKA